MMKLGFVTDDGATISAHFGQATHAVIVEVDDQRREVGRTLVDLSSGAAGVTVEVPLTMLADDDDHDDHEHAHGERGGHQHGPNHGLRFSVLAGCDVVIGRGMGEPAVAKLQAGGAEVFLVNEKTIDAALAAWQAGTLAHDARRVHRH